MNGSRPSIRYELWSRAWREYVSRAEQLVDRDGARRICDVGGGANPALSLEFIRTRELDYVVVDRSVEELGKAPVGYSTLEADAAAVGGEFGDGDFDLVLTRLVAEHVTAPFVFHRNIHRALAEEGRAFHFFSTLYELPFLANLLLGERMSRRILNLLQSSRDAHGPHAKFPARYRWCRGPTSTQLRRFRAVGFDVEEYVGFFGHNYYERVGPLQWLEDRFAAYLVRHPVPLLTSYAHVLLRRAAAESRAS